MLISQICQDENLHFWFRISSTENEKWNTVKCYPNIIYTYISEKRNIQITDTLVAGVNYNTLQNYYTAADSLSRIANDSQYPFIDTYWYTYYKPEKHNNETIYQMLIGLGKDTINIVNSLDDVPDHTKLKYIKPLISVFDKSAQCYRNLYSNQIENDNNETKTIFNTFLNCKIKVESKIDHRVKYYPFFNLETYLDVQDILNDFLYIDEDGFEINDITLLNDLEFSLCIDDVIYDNLYYAIGLYYYKEPENNQYSFYRDKFLLNVLNPQVYVKQEFKNDFGPMYRGWGQFEYNASKNRYGRPIDTDSLFLPKDTSNFILEDLHMLSLAPHVETKRFWQGLSDNVRLSADTMTSGRMLSNDIKLKSFLAKDGGYRAPSIGDSARNYRIEAPILLTKQKSTSYGIQGSFSLEKMPKCVKTVLSANAGYDYSSGESVKTVDYIDMNGDGFPDYFNEGKILYSNSRGTITDIYTKNRNNTDITQREKITSSSFGIGVSGSLGCTTPTVNPEAMSNEIARSCNASANVSVNKSNVELAFYDINGDGLPDLIEKDNKGGKQVSINLGYRFSDPFTPTFALDFTETNAYSKNFGAGEGVDVLGFSIGKGVGSAVSNSFYKLMDVNGDGLPDLVYSTAADNANMFNYMFESYNKQTYVKLNDGIGFNPTPVSLGNSIIDCTSSTSVSANAGGGWGFWIPFTPLKFVFSGNLYLSSTNSQVTCDVRDMNGDGLPDLVSTDNNNDNPQLKFNPSVIKYTNKLKSATNSLGGKFTLDYERSTPTTDHPGGKWVMKSVIVDDGISFDGENSTYTFDYSGGKYNRREREFDGFGKVVSSIKQYKALQLNGTAIYTIRRIEQTYDVSNTYTKGNLLSIIIYGGGTKCQETNNKYHYYNVKTRRSLARSKDDSEEEIKEGGRQYDNYIYYPVAENQISDTMVMFNPVKYTETKLYVASTGTEHVKTSTFYDYWVNYENVTNHFGELKTFRSSNSGQLDENGNGNYDYRTSIDYFGRMNEKFFVSGLPKECIVKNQNNKVLRHIIADYGEAKYPTHLTKIKQMVDNDSLVSRFVYDAGGNIKKKTLPSGMSYTYVYDHTYKMYPIQISDTLGYVSKLEDYDYRFGIPLKTTDINGNVQTTEIDDRGRITKIKGPNEADYTIKFEYHPEAVTLNTDGTIKTPAYAVTKHYDPQRPDNPIETVTFTDGFGRPVQVKKDAYIAGAEKMIVSGKVKYDVFGRPVENYYPQVADKNYTMFDYAASADSYKTVTDYDMLDRVVLVTTPDNNETRTLYYITNIDGANLLKSRIIDPENNHRFTYTDGAGKTVRTEQYYTNPETNKTDTIATKFEYDAIDQLVKVTDAMGKQTLSEYDMAGRRIKVTHPASGVTQFAYDKAGNLAWKYTANKDTIKYAYDYNRLKSIVYPRHPENNVKYTYGDKNAVANLKARLILQEDGSGAQAFKYGNMGELTEVTRTLVIPNQAVATYTAKWEYDSWNRVQKMTYPDGEEVNYAYDLGGNLASVIGSTTYVANIAYDKFDQRQSITYGNGTVTNYTYNPANRRLSNLTVKNGSAVALMNNAYTYDKAGNVTKLENSAAATNNIGGGTTHNYGYDNLYRLTSANGTFAGAGTKKATYNLSMGYDNLHNITSKKQNITQTDLQFTGTLNAGYALNYTYNGNNAQQIASIEDESYRGETSETPKETRSHLYRYDANGNLLQVSTGTMANDSVLRAVNERKLLWDEENRLLALSDNGYVSNYIYDAAGERTVKMHGGSEGVTVNGRQAAARLGAVDFTAYVSPYLVVSAGGNYTKHIYAGSQRITSKLGTGMMNALTATKAGGNNSIYTVKDNLIQAALKAEYDSLGVKYGKIKSTFDMERGTAEIADDPVVSDIPRSTGLPETSNQNLGNPISFGNLLYFYHPDHLGSSSLITGSSGEALQHIEYVPFGETFIDERNGTWHTPYLFNAKELDEETGLYYYGARYYDPKTSVWISVDPLAEKYPTVSSYVYCIGNPIIFKDVDGRDVYLATETKGTGHTFLVVKKGNNIIVYTYGRYQGGKWYTAGTTGPGVLVRYSGEKAKDYIRTELYRMNAKFFRVKDANDDKTKANLENQYNSSSETPTSDSRDINSNGRVIDTYSLFGNNCTTKSCDAVKDGGSNIFDVDGVLYDYDEDFTIPSSLQEFLQNASNTGNNVVDETDIMKTLFPNVANKKVLRSAGSSGTSSGSSGDSSGSSANSSSVRATTSGNGSGSNGSGSSSSQDKN
ncbi:MAG: RHS repeat-associated core domain-containing protein [Paludibacteraceae bacterium]